MRPMTQEVRYIFELEDIKTIRCVCPNPECSAEISCPPDVAYRFPDACPHCRTEWAKPDEHDLLSAISRLLTKKASRNQVKLKFETCTPQYS